MSNSGTWLEAIEDKLSGVSLTKDDNVWITIKNSDRDDNANETARLNCRGEAIWCKTD